MADSSQKKIRRNAITHKTWSLVTMALLWGRKGGFFKRWPLLELRSLFSKHLKALAHMRHHSSSNGDRYYGERQLSFDETPLFNVKKHRPTTASMRSLLPCIAPPPVDFDYDFEMDGQDYSDDVQVQPYGYDELLYESCTEEDDEEEEKGVDVRAEEFIAKFYEQIKLQRQVSYLEYKQHNSYSL